LEQVGGGEEDGHNGRKAEGMTEMKVEMEWRRGEMDRAKRRGEGRK